MAYGIPPTRPDVHSWLDAGLAAHRQGDLERAIGLYREALTRAPENADALNLIGTALLQAGEPGQGVHYMEQAAHRQRNDPRILANLGQCYIALKRFGDACAAFRKASRIEPQEVQFHLGVATALALDGNTAEAQTLLKRLATRFPGSALVWLNLGNVARDQMRRQDAIDHYARAAELEPQLIEARNSLGSALHAKLRFAEAEEQYRECIRLAPGHPLAQFNLASVLMDLGRFAEAESVARALVAGAPDAPEAHGLLGAALGLQSRLLEAHACYERAASLQPDNAKCAQTMAMSFMETGRTVEGLRAFSRAIKLGDELGTRQLFGVALLADGALQDGWAEYRSRPDAVVFLEKHPEVPVTQEPLGDVQKRHVCVLREQGLGDELFFLRYAPALVGRGARITYRASDKIASLVSRVACVDQVIREDAPLPAADAYVLAGDLPHVVAQCPASKLPDAPVGNPALREFKRLIAVYWPRVPASLQMAPLASRSDEIRARLAELGPPPYIGVTWRAGTLPEEQRTANWLLFKAIDLQRLAATLADTDGTLVALQRAPGAGEIAALETAVGRQVHDLSALNDDLEGMLALLEQLDEYVGVSNTNMHLRVAVGKTARVLVPAPAEWRWMRAGRASPWFPGFTVYRQSLQGDWSEAFATLKRDLDQNYSSSRQSVTS